MKTWSLRRFCLVLGQTPGHSSKHHCQWVNTVTMELWRLQQQRPTDKGSVGLGGTLQTGFKGSCWIPTQCQDQEALLGHSWHLIHCSHLQPAGTLCAKSVFRATSWQLRFATYSWILWAAWAPWMSQELAQGRHSALVCNLEARHWRPAVSCPRPQSKI
jgi:hypothetical protein